MPTDTRRLALSSQDYRLHLDLLEPRAFMLADVDGYGADVAAATADPRVSGPVVQGYQGVIDFGAISGSVGAGGFTCGLTIPEFDADWAPFYGVEIRCATVHGGIFGVVGAAGTDTGDRGVLLFRGYQQTATTNNAYGAPRVQFGLATSHAFLQRAGFSRGIDWAAGLDHSGPTLSNTILGHLIDYHTNLKPRSDFGVYLPDHAVDSYSINGGNLYGMLKGVADNFSAGEGMVYCRREDDLYIGSHPGMIPDLHPNVDDPIIHITEDITLHGDNGEPGVVIGEQEGAQAASVQLDVTFGDLTTYATPVYYQPGGIGDRVTRQIRTDDWAMANVLAQRLLAHLNRQYRDVRVRLPLNIAVDLGDVVTLSVDGSNNNRGIIWNEKKFFTTAVNYLPNLAEHTFQVELTLDEIVEQVV